MRSEFQKPTRMPSHSSPVQAALQAAIQGSTVRWPGQARMLPRRISSMVFKDVSSMIQSGSRKKAAETSRKA